MASTRQRSLSAAVELVGTEGVRALTHTRVDARAGLARGSTSNWFRTRRDLIAGVIDHMADDERRDAGDAGDLDAHGFSAAMIAMVEAETGLFAARSRARYALFLEAATDAALLAPLVRQRLLFEEWVGAMLRRIGADARADAVHTLMAGLDGLILHRLTVDPEAPVAPVVRRLVDATLPR